MKKCLLVVVGTFVLVACSSDSTGPTTPAGGTGANLDRLVQAICTNLATCSPLDLQQLYGDAAGCATKLGQLQGKVFRLSGNTANQAQIDACVAKIGSACTSPSNIPECEFKGSLAENAPCVDNAQCATGSCFRDATSLCGTCKARVAVGQSCASNDCEVGLVCNQGATNGAYTCVAEVTGEGTACDEVAKPCSNSFNCVDGKCTAPPAKDAACDEDKGNFCARGLQCAKNTCKDVPLAAAGAKCGLDASTQLVTKCVASTCSDFAGDGTCGAFLAKGAACTFEGPSCDLGLVCENDVCVDTNDEAVCH